MEVRIGCTGWSYAGWQGNFYPGGMEPSAYLRYYSSVFDVTEINSTFYNIPSSSVARRWNGETPENFMFAAKLPRSITHEGRLRPGPDLDRFLGAIGPLGGKLAVLVIQLPPSLSFGEAEPHLDKMARHVPRNYRYAVEGRHASWFSEDSYRFLRERNLCLVWNEVSGVENPAPLTSDMVYLRLIGDRSIPEKDFGTVRRDRSVLVQKWADRLEAVRDRISLAVAVANNRFEGFGPVTANKLRVSMELPYAKWTCTAQRSLADFGNP
ncbi:MAG: DUF72 domain-containing protein [Thaumarchaeota archaeon]|nr:DUF72 domain-containing protein [Nitrososphaerota archaeon]